MSLTRFSLFKLDDDVLIHVFSFLEIADILAMRGASKRLYSLSRLQTVWQAACHRHVTNQQFPFPDVPIDTMDVPELERRTRRAFRVGRFWLSPAAAPTKLLTFSASSGMPVSKVRFLPAHPDWLLSVSTGIWSVITCWDVFSRPGGTALKLAEWSPRGSIFTGIAVNSDKSSEGILAVSANSADQMRVRVLAVRAAREDTPPAFECLAEIDSPFRVISLHGDILAISDDANETQIVNWRTGARATLQGFNESSENYFHRNRCLKVVFAEHSVLVARARSFEAFAWPQLLPDNSTSKPSRPVACHGFGWIDNVAVSESWLSKSGETAPEPLSVVLRTESDDPWSSDTPTLDLYHLQPVSRKAGRSGDDDDDALRAEVQLPYVFPPLHRASLPSTRGHPRCTDVVLGHKGTAVWIQPRPARNADLTGFDVHASDAQGTGQHPLTGARIPKKELLVAAVLPGAMRNCHGGLDDGIRTLWTLDDISRNWTSVDYDEARGVVALGDSHGEVVLLDLVA